MEAMETTPISIANPIKKLILQLNLNLTNLEREMPIIVHEKSVTKMSRSDTSINSLLQLNN
jgi:hypothetical protein